MNIQHQAFEISKTANLYQLGTISKEIQHLWIVCHGYGQLASHFIRRFDALDERKNLIVAPEGLSHFYVDGVTGQKVGASWMTKHERLSEIKDNANYLQNVYDHYTSRLQNVRIHLLGFSQGCATQVRWIVRNKPKFDSLVLWAGLLPEDLNYKDSRPYLEQKQIYWIYGNQDIYLTENRIDFHRKFAVEQGIQLIEKTFIGGHTVPRIFLASLKF